MAGLTDRSSRWRRLRAATADDLVPWVEALRRERWTGFPIALATGLSLAMVSLILRRLKLNWMRDLGPAVALIRYEHPSPGDFLRR